jgi:hypothetical protein
MWAFEAPLWASRAVSWSLQPSGSNFLNGWSTVSASSGPEGIVVAWWARRKVQEDRVRWRRARFGDAIVVAARIDGRIRETRFGGFNRGRRDSLEQSPSERGSLTVPASRRFLSAMHCARDICSVPTGFSDFFSNVSIVISMFGLRKGALLH